MEGKYRFVCEACGKTFRFGSNLKKHIKIKHDAEAPVFNCEHCKFKSKTNYSLMRHIKTRHKIKKDPTLRLNKCYPSTLLKTPFQCPLCDISKLSRHEMEVHYLEAHNIVLEHKTMEFPTENDFIVWKDEIEKQYSCEFITKQSRYSSKDEEVERFVLVCHRDGVFKRRSDGKRRLKSLGSNKINGHCPAIIKAMVNSSSRKVNIYCCLTHVGHDLEVARLRLNKKEREFIEGRISKNISVSRILEEVRSIFVKTDSLSERIHMISRKDILNIKQQYILKGLPIDVNVPKEPCVNESESSEDSVYPLGVENYKGNVDCPKEVDNINFSELQTSHFQVVAQYEFHSENELIEDEGDANKDVEFVKVEQTVQEENKQVGDTEDYHNETFNVDDFLNPAFDKIKDAKEKLVNQFKDILDQAETEDDLEIVSKFLWPIIPTIEADRIKRQLSM